VTKKALCCGLFALLGGLVAGCTNACGRAANDIDRKYLDCGIEVQDPTEEPEPPACTEELGAQQACSAKCFTDASCEALKGSDGQAAAELAECLGDC
jgi:hypothetical protein